MQTDALIRVLSSHLEPVPLHPVARRVAIGLAIGAIATFSMLVLVLGLRPDLAIAIHGASFWMKWIYTASLGVGGIIATAHLARPDATRSKAYWLLLIPFVALAVMAGNELLDAPRDQWLDIWLGHSWHVCSICVLLFSVPIFIGLLWSFRRFAPTNLRAAGAAAGFASGAIAATLYCLHCPEVSALFVLTWYTLGIVLATAIGALLGPRLMRW